MATQTNAAARPTSARRLAAVLTAANTSLVGPANGSGGAVAVQLGAVGANGLSWLVKLGVVPRANIAAFNVSLFWSPDNGTTLYLIQTYPIPASSTASRTETDLGFTEAAFRLVTTGVSLWVASDTALAAGIVVNAEIEDN